MPDDKSLDILGVKGLSDSIKIATERFLDAAAAFLSRVCLPAAEEFGLALRDKVSAWRARNAARMLSTANELLEANQSGTTQKVHPRLVHIAIEEASWTDDDPIQKMWAGLLASSTSVGGLSDDSLIFMNLLNEPTEAALFIAGSYNQLRSRARREVRRWPRSSYCSPSLVADSGGAGSTRH